MIVKMASAYAFSSICVVVISLFLLCSSVTAHASPSYVISLDAAPEDRWKQVSIDFKEEIKETYDILSQVMPPELVPLAEKFADEFEKYLPAKFVKEIKEPAVASAGPATAGFQRNTKRNSRHCTSIVAQDSEGLVWHARNMDYDFTEILKNSTIVVEFQKSNKTLYRGVTYAGYIGILTGERPGSFSVTVDERDAGDPLWYNALVALFENNTSIMSMAVRDVLEEQESFQDAVEMLASTNVPAPVYYIIGGAHPGEGAILTKERTHLVDIWLLAPFHDRWFILETNYDHWKPPPSSDDRRDPANKMMKELGPNGVNSKSLFQVLSTPPVINNSTVYTTIMSAGKSSVFSNYIRR